MEFLLERFSIPKENSYAFGDSPNDLPMLKAAESVLPWEIPTAELKKTVLTRQVL